MRLLAASVSGVWIACRAQCAVAVLNRIDSAKGPARTVKRSVAAAPAPTAEQKKKGWSGAAKGAVIGAGVGAIGGAVIDKKKPAQGAIIGGLAGAGLGAGTGAILDSKKNK